MRGSYYSNHQCPHKCHKKFTKQLISVINAVAIFSHVVVRFHDAFWLITILVKPTHLWVNLGSHTTHMTRDFIDAIIWCSNHLYLVVTHSCKHKGREFSVGQATFSKCSRRAKLVEKCVHDPVIFPVLLETVVYSVGAQIGVYSQDSKT